MEKFGNLEKNLEIWKFEKNLEIWKKIESRKTKLEICNQVEIWGEN